METHVRSLDETKSWCSELLGSEFHFKGVEQAVFNGIHRSNLITCSACANRIIAALVAGCEVFHAEQKPEGSKETIA